MSSYARELWDLGIRDLVCVTPPGGRLSPSSRIAPEAMGKAPGRLNQQGQWGGYDWQRHQATEEDVAKWDHDRANIGIKGSTFPAFDIDVDNPEMAALISNLIQKKLGLCIMRSSRPPRLLLAYQAAVPGEITRHRLRFHYEGEEHMVELLGDGQQWVASGLHPSGLT